MVYCNKYGRRCSEIIESSHNFVTPSTRLGGAGTRFDREFRGSRRGPFEVCLPHNTFMHVTNLQCSDSGWITLRRVSMLI
jgi:hypothetical protein